MSDAAVAEHTELFDTEVVGEQGGDPIRRTMDYDLFYYDPRNREISEPHLSELIASIQSSNRLDKNPIVVNSDGRILDGQHRLEAAREIGVPIYFRVDDGMSMEEVPQMNRAQKSWTAEDYLNFYAESGREAYQRLRSFIERHPHLSLTFSAELLGENKHRFLKEFRRGNFEIENEEWAERVAEYIRDYFELGHEFSNKKTFCRAVKRVARSEHYDHDRMLRKSEQLGLQHQGTVEDYLRQFERLFNHSRSTRVQLW
jgi:hypothetical protein